MKKFLSVICVLSLGVLLFAGCGNNVANNKNEPTTQASKGKCSVFECVKNLSADNTLEQVNEIIGFEGVVIQESDENSTSKWKIYKWDLTDDTSIEVTVYESSKTISIASNYPKDLIKNKDVDLTKSSEIKSRINEEDGLMYDEVKEILGGVDGTLTKKSSYSNTYVWINENGGNITANFNPNTNRCTSFTGLIK